MKEILFRNCSQLYSIITFSSDLLQMNLNLTPSMFLYKLKNLPSLFEDLFDVLIRNKAHIHIGTG